MVSIPPQRIVVSQVTTDGQPATPVVRNTLRLLLPKIRSATERAEFDLGGADGDLRFSLRLSPDGSVREVLILEDSVGEPIIQEKASEVFEDLTFEHAAGATHLDFTVTLE